MAGKGKKTWRDGEIVAVTQRCVLETAEKRWERERKRLKPFPLRKGAQGRFHKTSGHSDGSK